MDRILRNPVLANEPAIGETTTQTRTTQPSRSAVTMNGPLHSLPNQTLHMRIMPNFLGRKDMKTLK